MNFIILFSFNFSLYFYYIVKRITLFLRVHKIPKRFSKNLFIFISADCIYITSIFFSIMFILSNLVMKIMFFNLEQFFYFIYIGSSAFVVDFPRIFKPLSIKNQCWYIVLILKCSRIDLLYRVPIALKFKCKKSVNFCNYLSPCIDLP